MADERDVKRLALIATLEPKSNRGTKECARCGMEIAKVSGESLARYYSLTLFEGATAKSMDICRSCAEKLRIMSKAVYATLSRGESKMSITFSQMESSPRK